MNHTALARWGLPLAIYLSAFLAILDANIVILALPAIEADLRADATSYQWVLDAYILCLSAFALSAGAVADRYGRKRVFLGAVLVFTAGIGENSPEIRKRVCRVAEWLGLALDEQANAANGLRIGAEKSRVAIFAIPTDEEIVIARHTRDLLGG